MKTSKKISLFVVPLVIFSLIGTACNSSDDKKKDDGTTGTIEFGDTEYYKTVEERAAFNLSDDRNITETFSGGMSDDYWYALEGAWHNNDDTAPHNGMKNRNLYYTQDKDGEDYLAIKGKGIYYKGDDFDYNKPEGGCILSKNHLGPGRYEIEMAALPREGAVSAMWTYCTTTGSEATSQNEIDIELGGSTNGTQFEYLWSTSWTKQNIKQTDTIDVTDYLYTNDREIHTYTFDWYTDYPGTHERVVDWFIDGIFMDSISGEVVPEYDMPLWIGVWFPPLWAGTPAFEEDYMLVKSVTYTAFEANQYYESCRTKPGYTQVVPSQVGISDVSWDEVKNVEQISNGHLDSLDIAPRNNSYYGWIEENSSEGTIELTSGASDYAFKLTAGEDDGSNSHGEYLDQTISNTYAGYKYDLSITAKLEDEESKGNIEIYYCDAYGGIKSSEKIAVTSTTWTDYKKTITMPSGCGSLMITLTSENGSVIYDEVSLLCDY